ncbi:hypothetical protein Tsubulata_043882 [Turnera subulata]|uniref:Bifunctional inhibitor/plant lipid transfer protein/seed storage helical domain-containing protein n=1 Tax=Turnera subulata TaxID=218843 RepID=A0A9Q0EZF2_9ROSI|nr:hypothetical protein Tsubulata_043882 [Turnera subulata]
MASKSLATIALLLSLNLLFFSMVSAKSNTCPKDTLKVGLCANVLGGLVKVLIGQPHPCCSLVKGLVDLDAAVCLCTVIKADLLGIKLRVPVDLSVLLNTCGKKLPKGFQCA